MNTILIPQPCSQDLPAPRNTSGGGDLRTIVSAHARVANGRPRMISRQNFPKRTHILLIPSKPYSVHSVIGSRMNGSFRKQNRPQKNSNTVYSKYSYSVIVPKECAFRNRETGYKLSALGYLGSFGQTARTNDPISACAIWSV